MCAAEVTCLFVCLEQSVVHCQVQIIMHYILLAATHHMLVYNDRYKHKVGAGCPLTPQGKKTTKNRINKEQKKHISVSMIWVGLFDILN